MSTSALSCFNSLVLLCMVLVVGCTSTRTVIREGSRVSVADVPPASGAGNGYVQGLETLLKHEGTPVSYSRLMGLSGIAFILQSDTGHVWDGQVDTGWWPLDSWGLELRKAFLAQAVGRKIEEYGYFFREDRSGETRSLPELYRNQIREPLETSINAGKLALGPFCPADGTWGFIISGYEIPVGTQPPIFGQCARDTRGNFGRCPNWPPGILILCERIPALSPSKADIQALRYAVALAHDDAGPTDMRYRGRRSTGQRSFAAWAGIMRDVDQPTSDHGNANVRGNLIENRRAAIAFLREIASRQGGIAAIELENAAKGYEQVVALAKQLNLTGLAEDPTIRRRLADYIEGIAAADLEAVGHIEKALNTMAGKERAE